MNASMTWRVLTWNILGAKHPPLDRVVAHIRHCEPDVVALQEVRRGQARRLARILGIRTIYLSTTMAADFFASRLGFRSVAIGDVDPAVREAANFQAGAALDNAVCMRLDVDAGG